MNLKEFFWHASRGHGECLLTLKNDDVFYYKDIVKNVFLNNYAFLLNDEYRSAYACELVSFFNDDEFYLKLLWNKINQLSIDDYYNFDYLINNLYFLLEKNVLLDYEEKIKKLLIKHLNKNIFTSNENNSICSIISLMLDLKLNINVEKIINDYYSEYKNSNLDLSNIKYYYNIVFLHENDSIKHENKLKSFDNLLELLSKDDANKMLPSISYNLNDENINTLLNYLDNININEIIKENILKVILYSKRRSFKIENKLVDFYATATPKQKNIICEIVSKTKSIKILIKLKSQKLEDSFWIRLTLNNYDENKYDELHQKIEKLKIDYSNSNNWFEVENELICYFKKRNIDKRLLVDLKYFLKNGLSSTSRYKIVIILNKHNMLSEQEIKYLKYDANYKIRQLFKN